jgi:DNA (cytosine-5)-methyltransferase 1
MLLIDFYCKAGGASMGYRRAGFDVVGVDIEPQPRYPFPFLQMDALQALDMLNAGEPLLFSDGLELLLADVQAAAASPPCKRFSSMTGRHGQAVVNAHPDLIGPTRERFQNLGMPYIIENVERAPLVDPVTVCGKAMGCVMSDGRVMKRHRIFESNVPLQAPACTCRRGVDQVLGVYGGTRRVFTPRTDKAGGDTPQATAAEAVQIMGIDWMTRREMTQAIPPVYTEHLGRQLAAHLQATGAAATSF